MKNGWVIKEKGASNGMHLLKIYVNGQLVKTIQRGSLKYLIQNANNFYREEYNKRSKWKIG